MRPIDLVTHTSNLLFTYQRYEPLGLVSLYYTKRRLLHYTGCFVYICDQCIVSFYYITFLLIIIVI